MRWSVAHVSFVILALILLTPNLWATPVGGDELREDLEFAKSKVYPALVNIQVVGQSFSGGRSSKFPAAGSGVIVSPAGHVLTNYHVAGETTRIVCTLPDRETIEARVIAHDPLTDISVLKLNLESREDLNTSLPFATLGDSEALEVGDYVLAMGNPLTLASSMTLGIVSNPRRVFTSFTGSEMDEMDLGEGQVTGLFTRWIQHDALILPGNSGGPLVNLRGEVVGINELGGSGVGFAIPSNLASHVLNQALTYGEVRRGWFGLSILPVLRLERDEGALVSWVIEKSPAHQAGIQAGDVLLALANEPVEILVFEEVPLFYKRMADFRAGEEIEVLFERSGEHKTTKLVVGAMEKYLDEEVELRTWGMTVRGITSHMALTRRYPGTEGVLITGVRPGRAADEAKPQLQSGDVIVEVNGQEIKDQAGFLKLAAEIGRDNDVALEILRGEESILTVIHLEEKKDDFEGGELPKAWVGIKTQVLTSDVAKLLFKEKKRGFRITRVFPGTEAAKAELRSGDVILALNGKTLKASRVQDSEMLRRRLENLTIGTHATLTIVRNGEQIEVEVLLEETPASAIDAKTAKNKFLEFAVREVTFTDRIEQKWDEDFEGLIVTDVTRGGWAHLAGLRTKDLLISVQDREITDVADFEELIKSICEERPRFIKLFLRRSFKTLFLFVEPDWSRYNDED